MVFEEVLFLSRLVKETMSSLFVIIQEETFNQWQRKNQDNFKWHFLQLVNTV